MSEMLDADREAATTTEEPPGTDQGGGPVPGGDREAVLVPFVVPHDQLNKALTDASDVWAFLNLLDRAQTLANASEELPDKGYFVKNRPITGKAANVVAFFRQLAGSITANVRGEPITIEELVTESYDRASRKGFWDDVLHVDPQVGISTGEVNAKINEKLLLTISELTEAMEELRKGMSPRAVYYAHERPEKPEGFSIELADAMIRIADLAGWLGLDLTDAIRRKAAYNESRPTKHGKQF